MEKLLLGILSAMHTQAVCTLVAAGHTAAEAQAFVIQTTSNWWAVWKDIIEGNDWPSVNLASSTLIAALSRGGNGSPKTGIVPQGAQSGLSAAIAAAPPALQAAAGIAVPIVNAALNAAAGSSTAGS